MAPYKRSGSQLYYLDIRWRGWPRIALSTGTTTKERANSMESALVAMKRANRRDIIGLLHKRRITLPEFLDAYDKRGDELEQLAMRAESPCLGDLVDEWFGYLKSPAGVSPRTKRRLSGKSIRRYEVSWQALFGALEQGRVARLSALTDAS